MTATSPPDIARQTVLERLRTDLIGPDRIEETLDSRPSDVWLTGILWPANTEVAPEEDERLAVAGSDEGGSDDDDAARPAGVSMRRPSAAGLSFAVLQDDGGVPGVNIRVAFGLYASNREAEGTLQWSRRQIEIGFVDVSLPEGSGWLDVETPGIEGVRINWRASRFPGGTLATVTLVNLARPAEAGREAVEKVTLFQTALEIEAAPGSRLVARPSRRAEVDDEDRSAGLLYRDAREFATGHTASASWTTEESGQTATSIRIAWIPDALTPPVSGDGHEVFAEMSAQAPDPLSAAWLAEADGADLVTGLERLCDAYGRWIGLQKQRLASLTGTRRETADRHILEAGRVLRRMRQGAGWLGQDTAARQAFQLANRAMTLQREWSGEGGLRWRPFQLGFLLLTLESSANGTHEDREVMDLLWFPTGGGKTEAYLGLIAFTAFHRRLSRARPDDGAGVAAIMRYTLRLLTTQQFVRASAMIFACEAIRRSLVPAPAHGSLGDTPFAIGLWVGADATPNSRADAYASRADPQKPTPAQLVDCPACHARLDYVQAKAADPVTARCRTATCILLGFVLPVWAVDADVYNERPTLLIGTVDKFAQIVRQKRTASLFGVGTGAQPQLILQDELHLISGPLGTLAGLYEAALDLILSVDGTRPKIIGSTATIRRANDQVLALFDRGTCQFPPPGLDATDSGFAVIDRRPEAFGRLYAGVTTAGRSAKFTLQAALASLLQTALAGLAEGDRDSYWTLVAYFNSLRELGGALVLTQDDVHSSLRQIARRRGEQDRIPAMVEELTSRRSQQEIRDMLNRLEIPAGTAGALDVVLATNMLSVGVDIRRLGLMVVNGQPKTIAEYIQATSRVGRGRVPGLVVALLNNAKPRDRSHYETFGSWHATLYRDVEATSVTPFASRARDRALHAVLVAVVRHALPGKLDLPALDDDDLVSVRHLIGAIAARAARIDPLETDVATELERRLDRWLRRSPAQYWDARNEAVSLLQGAEEAAAKRASGRSIGQAWPTPNTMRAVEPATPFRLLEKLRGEQ